MGRFGRRVSRIQRWSGATGSTTVESLVEELHPLLIAEMIERGMPLNTEVAECCIKFTSSGYSDPGVCSGPVESCYAPEGEDERTITEMSFVCYDDDGETIHEFDVEANKENDEMVGLVYEEFDTQIENADVDTSSCNDDYYEPNYHDDDREFAY